MAAVAGKPKSDAGQYKRPRPVVAQEWKELPPPTLALKAPLFHTLDQPKPPGAYYDEEAAEAAVEFIEARRHFKGRWAGSRLWLFEWQKVWVVRPLFGWKRADGTRLYRLAYVEAPRKGGKTTLAAGIALKLAHADGEAAPEVYFAAYDKDQAGICFDTARFITERDEELSPLTVVYNSRREMKLRDNPGGMMRVLSKETGKLYGINLHGAIFDELMTQKTRDLWDALTTSEGSREQSLIFAISTAGWDQHSVCFEQHELTRQIHEGVSEDPSFLGVVFGAPMDADWTDESVWMAANPSLGEKSEGASVDIEYYRRKATKARNQPTEQNAFRTLLLSQWVGQAERFLDMDAWDQCDGSVAQAEGLAAFGGLDLSATTDLTAFVVVAGRGKPEFIIPYVFLPEDGIADKEKRDRVPYREWARQGLLRLTPGKTVNYDAVREAIRDAALRFNLKDVTYDRWNATQFVADLEDDGLKMFDLGQGILQLSPPTKELLRLVTETELAHAGHPLLRWCASNVSPRTDSAGNVKPDKQTSAHRIDPIVALIMALDGWMRRGKEKRRSVYEDMYS